MAGPYYVDISAPGSWVGKTGLDKTTNALLGLSGLQYLADTITVGNGPIYVKGSASDGTKMVTFASDGGNSGTFQRGEAVTWSDGDGVVSEISGNYATVIEIITLGSFGDDVEYTGSTSTAKGVVNGAVSQKASIIDIDTQTGSNAAGFIQFIGCNDDEDYTVTGNRAVIDAATGVADVILVNATPHMIWLENIDCRRAGTAKNGINFNASYVSGWVFVNCSFHDNAQHGIRCVYSRYATIYRCCIYNNTGTGINAPYASRIILSAIYENSTDGISDLGASNQDVCYGSIIHGNNDMGFENSIAGVVLNSVIDANVAYGFDIIAHANNWAPLLIGNRITNHSGTGDRGISATSEALIYGFNYFDGNTDDIYVGSGADLCYPLPEENGTTDSNRDSETQDDADCGYVDSSGHNFATNYTDADDPTLRRTAITIPWT